MKKIALTLILILGLWFVPYPFSVDKGYLPTVSSGNYIDGIPVGAIIMWSGSVDSIPNGWQIADGTNSTPDLRNSFVIGAGDIFAVNDFGGTDEINIDHNHAGGALIVDDNLHSHDHSFINMGAPTGTHNPDSTGITGEDTTASDIHTHQLTFTTDGDVHSHVISGNTTNSLSTMQPILNPYYALFFIVKICEDNQQTILACVI